MPYCDHCSALGTSEHGHEEACLEIGNWNYSVPFATGGAERMTSLTSLAAADVLHAATRTKFVFIAAFHAAGGAT